MVGWFLKSTDDGLHQDMGKIESRMVFIAKVTTGN